ncbi:MAG TPA: hypothetical protein EYH50_01360 [Pyrodictium delaneyi]|uniref:Amidohydrolase n=1 Tax=Pyrodictium delaneyi TaxID=1273541 RepID=A0A832ZT24_9CREN|nr:hypothetical protein [Pyrodictium delaneyi]
MPLRILFYDVYYFDENGVVHGPGYIHVSAGTIDYIGLGEPPEEAQYAELVAGGPGRIVYPGFASLPVFLESYPFRHLLADIDPVEYMESSVADQVRSMGSREAYYSALMALYELTMHGYTRVVSIDPHVDAVARAIIDAGLEGAVLYPHGCGLTPRKEFTELLKRMEEQGIDRRRVSVGIAMCGSTEPPEEAMKWAELVYSLEARSLWVPDGSEQAVTEQRKTAIPGPMYPHTASPWTLMASREHRDVYTLLTQTIHMLFDPGYSVYGEKRPVYLVVVDATEPPGWLPAPEYARPWSLSGSRPRVETVVSGGRLVVDGGEHLAIGSNAARQASEAIRRILG